MEGHLSVSASSRRSEVTTPDSVTGPQLRPLPTASEDAKEFLQSLESSGSELQSGSNETAEVKEGVEETVLAEGSTGQPGEHDGELLPDGEILEGTPIEEENLENNQPHAGSSNESIDASKRISQTESSKGFIPSAAALFFIDNLEESDFEHSLFSDVLITCSDLGKELGELEVSIAPAFHEGRACFLVHANSHGAIDNIPCGTSITAYVTKTMETLEQHHHEYVKLANHPLDRKTHIVKQADNYLVSRIISQGEDVQRKTHTFTHQEMIGFISEGSNLLLQRLLVLKGVPYVFQLVSFDSDANLCPTIYRALPVRSQIIQETEIETTGIERTINSNTDLPTTWQSYFMEDGHLTSRVQVGSPVTMRLVTLPPTIPIEEEIERPTFEKRDLVWEDDMELYSKYLDKKDELKADYAYYMRKHPELKAMLADFVQFLLLQKPDDTIAFAAEYFASFTSKIPGTKPFQESAEPVRYRFNCLNPKIEHLMKILS